MIFEEFEKKAWEKGYGIVAMNHYTINSKRYTYCVVLGKDKKRAFQFEAEKSEKVFKNIYEQIVKFEKQND